MAETRLRGMADLQKLVWAMSQPRAFYILGAGASYGLIPVTQQMRAGIKRNYLEAGIFPVSRTPRTALHDRVVGKPVREAADWNEMLLQNIPVGALELFVQRELYLPIEDIAPPQYAIFDAVGTPATIFNFNLDGLASLFCSAKHVVLEPHGRGDWFWFKDESNYEYWREATTAFDVRLPVIIPKLLPSPEPNEIVSSLPYQVARRLFRLAPAVLIVGYSFANWNGRRDDSASWNFLIRLLKRYPKTAFVISPFPEELTATLQEKLSSSNVVGVSIFWETFATVLLAGRRSNSEVSAKWSDIDLRRLHHCYERAVDNR